MGNEYRAGLKYVYSCVNVTQCIIAVLLFVFQTAVTLLLPHPVFIMYSRRLNFWRQLCATSGNRFEFQLLINLFKNVYYLLRARYGT